MDLNAIRGDLAGKLTAAGVRNVTVDVAQVQPPCVLVDLPTVELVGSPRVDVAVTVRIIAPPPGNLAAVRRLLDDLAAVMVELRPREAHPEPFNAGGAECPAYTATVHVPDALC